MAELKLDDLIDTINQNQDKIETQGQKIVDQLEKFQKSKTATYKQKNKLLNKKLEREENYKIVSQDITKWQPIVKKNREANQIDFREQKDIAHLNFNSRISIQNKKQDFQHLSKRKLLTEQEYEQRIQEQLKNAKNTKNIQEEIMKQKHLMLYKELKQKRLKKIKSKVYRRIKKRNQRKKDEANFQQKLLSDKNFALEELEKMERRRAEERSQMRHRNKSNYTRLLRKYAGEQAAQQAFKDLNIQRQEIEDKLHEITQKAQEQSDSDYEKSDFQEEAIEELDQLIEDKNIEQNKSKSMLQEILLKQNQQAINEAKLLKEQIRNDDWEQIELDESNQEVKNIQIKDQGRKIYQNQEQLLSKKQKQESKKIVDMNELINQELGLEKQVIEKSIKKETQKKQPQLLDGINLEKIKKKYKEDNFNLNEQGKNILNQQEQNFQKFEISSENEYQEAFEKEKLQDFEDELSKEDPMENMKGWGSWTGFGVKESQRQIEQKRQKLIEKKKKIEEIKKRRKDGKLNRVIINEKRPKVLKKYLVEQLPFGMDNKEQFNFRVSRPVGPEWNTEGIFRNNIKKKILNYVGDEIKPLDKKYLPKTKFL